MFNMNYKRFTINLEITNYKFGARPGVSRPDPEVYKVLGEAGIRKMVSRHYELLRVSSIDHLFAKDDSIFEITKKNSADFMIQICGGPDYYNQNRGKPMLANRHAAFSITAEARIEWLNCYKKALLELNAPEHIVLSLWNYLNVFSSWMVNEEKNT